MDTCNQETLIVALAHLMAGKQVANEVLSGALSLLCNSFGFEYAFIYEVDPFDNLCLLEKNNTVVTKAQTKFALGSVLPKLYDSLLHEPVLYCEEKSPHTPEQKQLLSLLGAKSFAALSVTDNTGHIYGLITLCNSQTTDPWSEATKKNIEAAFSIISNHIAVRMYKNRLNTAQITLENILDNTGIDIYVNDFYTHDILYVNKSMAAPYGGQDQFTNRKCWQVLFPGQAGPCEFCPQNKIIDENGNPSKIYTWDYQRAFDGSWFRVFSAAFRWADNRLAHVVSSADITDNKRNEEIIKYMANYDSLTNLPNRRMLVAECEKRINKDSINQVYLLFFDIDGFKKINDTLGHDSGDEFLIKLSEFFSGIPMLKDSIYRNGGDEFVALLGENITAAHVRSLAHFIHMRFKSPWELKKGSVMCNTSIGVAMYPEDATDSENLLHKADQAMYRAKKDGGGTLYFANQLTDSKA